MDAIFDVLWRMAGSACFTLILYGAWLCLASGLKDLTLARGLEKQREQHEERWLGI